jgi:hypothetical protein
VPRCATPGRRRHGGGARSRKEIRSEAATQAPLAWHDVCSVRARVNPRTAVRLAGYLAAACACVALAGACGASGGEGHCLNPQPLPPFCGPEPLPPITVQLPSDAGKADGEGGPDAGAD